MIHRYDNKSLARWENGDLKVKILVPTSERPVAYCDGTEEDEAELRDIAEAEGTELPTIRRKILKTGREIWTIGEAPTPQEDDEW
jgi:hypothetical protein